MYVLIRDLNAKLLLENIDDAFQKNNEKLLENVDEILKRDVLDGLISSDLKEEMDILKKEIRTLKKHDIYLNSL